MCEAQIKACIEEVRKNDSAFFQCSLLDADQEEAAYQKRRAARQALRDAIYQTYGVNITDLNQMCAG